MYHVKWSISKCVVFFLPVPFLLISTDREDQSILCTWVNRLTLFQHNRVTVYTPARASEAHTPASFCKTNWSTWAKLTSPFHLIILGKHITCCSSFLSIFLSDLNNTDNNALTGNYVSSIGQWKGVSCPGVWTNILKQVSQWHSTGYHYLRE